MTNQESNISTENKQAIRYIASPYTSDSAAIMEYRHKDALRCLTYYTKAGIVCFSPIVHNHPVAQLLREGDSRDRPGWEYWEMFDRAFLMASSELWILTIDGWHESVGIKAEVEIARKLGLPVFTVEETRNGYSISERTYSEIEKAVRT